jgi:hypothetical protein
MFLQMNMSSFHSRLLIVNGSGPVVNTADQASILITVLRKSNKLFAYIMMEFHIYSVLGKNNNVIQLILTLITNLNGFKPVLTQPHNTNLTATMTITHSRLTKLTNTLEDMLRTSGDRRQSRGKSRRID